MTTLKLHGLMRIWWRRSGLFVLIYATVLHIIWGVLLLSVPKDSLRVTPLAYVLNVFGQRYGAALLLGAALCTGLALRMPGRNGLLMSLPQNALLFMSAVVGVVSALSGRYPDGVLRPGPFIFTDQLPMILVAPLHALSLVLYHGLGWDTRQKS